METCNKNDNEKIKTLLKGIEGNIVQAMMSQIENK